MLDRMDPAVLFGCSCYLVTEDDAVSEMIRSPWGLGKSARSVREVLNSNVVLLELFGSIKTMQHLLMVAEPVLVQNQLCLMLREQLAARTTPALIASEGLYRTTIEIWGQTRLVWVFSSR